MIPGAVGAVLTFPRRVRGLRGWRPAAADETQWQSRLSQALSGVPPTCEAVQEALVRLSAEAADDRRRRLPGCTQGVGDCRTLLPAERRYIRLRDVLRRAGGRQAEAEELRRIRRAAWRSRMEARRARRADRLRADASGAVRRGPPVWRYPPRLEETVDRVQ